MANYRKKANKTARAGCHYCKPWKLGIYSRENQNFESYSSHKNRIRIKEEVEDWQRG